MIDPDAALDFLGFVEARHQVWEARQAGLPQPWTDEPIVASRKFTNVFRILDHGTQFILTDLVQDGLSERDMLMRLFLYRHTGRVEVWEYLTVALGEYPTVENLDDVAAAWKEYRGATKVVTKSERKPGQTGRGNGFQKTIGQRSVFTSAYLVFPQSAERGTDKLDSIIALTRRLFDPSSPTDLVPDFLAAHTQADRFACLRRNKGVADFMSYQVLSDWGYTPHCGQDQENDFVVPGPGARKGAAFLDPRLKAEQVIPWAARTIHGSSECPVIHIPGSGPRKPSLLDIQNTLCEYSKYVRFQKKKPSPIKLYTPAHPGPRPEPVFPGHW